MAKAAALRGILDRVFPTVKPTDTWSVIKVERLLKEVGAYDYEFDYEPKCVYLASEDDLLRIVVHLMPSEITDDTSMIITEFNGMPRLRIGNWQFKVSA